MSREFPDFIDPWRAADGRKHYSGTIPLKRMKRLAPLLESPAGEAVFKLDFAYDGQRRVTASIRVEAFLSLLCQRSLEPFDFPVAQASVLQVILEPGEQALLSDHEEFVMAADGRLAILDMVEDELLLAVPQVPRNPKLDFVDQSYDEPKQSDDSGTVESDPTVQRPFEGLAELLKKN